MTNMMTNAGEDEMPPVKGMYQLLRDDKDEVVGGEGFVRMSSLHGRLIARMGWKMGSRTVAMNENPSSPLEGTVDERLGPIIKTVQSYASR